MIGTPRLFARVTSFPSAPVPAGSSSDSSTLTVSSFCIFASISRPRRPSEATREQRERKREKEREDEPDGGPECTADEVAGRRRADPIDNDGGGHDRDVWRAEPSQDRAGRRQKKNDEDLVVRGRDLG